MTTKAKTKPVNPSPIQGAKGFLMSVMPNRVHLCEAIEKDGFCDPRNCWHKVAISAIVEAWGPGGPMKVRVDAGHVKLNYRGWRYVADTPRHVKRSLMLFDKKRYDEVHVREYNLRFRRLSQIKPLSRERKDLINKNRLARIAAGNGENKRKYPNMRQRVEGFSAIV